jgi:hypothetical protein
MVSVDRIMHSLLMLRGRLGELLIRMGHLWIEAVEATRTMEERGRTRRGALL